MKIPGNETVSVAMCTYNGALYIQEQIESILSQSRRPDELVICDDQSTDSTREIIADIAARSPIPIRLIEGEIRHGVTKNFERCLQQCRGDIIFLCDQDDVWLHNKVETFVDQFQRHPGAVLLYADAQLVDDTGRELAPSWWKLNGLNSPPHSRGQEFNMLVCKWFFSGFNMAVRRKLVEWALPFETVCHHDAWLALMSPHVGEIIFLPEVTARYRQHGGNLTLSPVNDTNAVDMMSSRDREHKRNHDHFRAFADRANVLRALLRRSKSSGSIDLDLDYLKVCRSAQEFFQAVGRCDSMPAWRGASELLAQASLGRYHSFRGGWRDWMNDVRRLAALRHEVRLT